MNPFLVFQILNSSFVKTIFFVILFLLIIERISNTFRKRYESKTKKVYQKKMFYVLLLSYLICVAAAVMDYVSKEHINIAYSLAGGLVYAAAALLRRNSIAKLEHCWSVFVEIKEEQRLINEGVYRYLKHPYYLAVVGELCGFAMICNSMLSIMLIIFLQMPLVAVRIFYETRIIDVYKRRMKLKS